MGITLKFQKLKGVVMEDEDVLKIDDKKFKIKKYSLKELIEMSKETDED